MLCKFCSNIDLDQLATVEGYKHHSSCANLFQSVKDGCESCEFILASQWVEAGGDLQQGSDIGSVETQIITKTVNQVPGQYEKIRFGQVARYDRHRSMLMTAYNSDTIEDSTPKSAFLWSFLMVAASPNDRSSSYIKLRPLARRDSESWVHLTSNWLVECLAGHEDCSHQTSAKIMPPTRVIDVGQQDDYNFPFLHTSGEEVQEWVTLSHCWGQTLPLKTTMQSLSEHQQALPLAKLPKLFHEAILITWKLGFRYLWIDSHCIIQDSHEDWVRESSNMGNIYKHCVFMISTDHCRDSQESILEKNSTEKVDYVQQGCFSSKEGFKSVMYTYAGEGKETENSRVLASRAWAHQEAVLSPRTLHWTPLQVSWTCRTMIRSEENPSGSQHWPSRDKHYSVPTKTICLSQERFRSVSEGTGYNVLELWYHLVKQFSGRKITFEKDTFAAISGLAKEVKRLTRYDYKAGLWAENIHNGLLWSTDGLASPQQNYVAPSWSWASIRKGATVNSSCIGGQLLSLIGTAEILEIQLVYAAADEFGAIASGKLRIHAPSRAISSFESSQIRSLPDENDPFHSSEELSAHMLLSSAIICWLDARAKEEGQEATSSVPYSQLAERGAFLARIATVENEDAVVPEDSNFFHMRRKRKFQNQNWALVLEPVIGDGEWRRIGIARIADALIDGWESRDFTVI